MASGILTAVILIFGCHLAAAGAPADNKGTIRTNFCQLVFNEDRKDQFIPVRDSLRMHNLLVMLKYVFPKNGKRGK